MLRKSVTTHIIIALLLLGLGATAVGCRKKPASDSSLGSVTLSTPAPAAEVLQDSGTGGLESQPDMLIPSGEAELPSTPLSSTNPEEVSSVAMEPPKDGKPEGIDERTDKLHFDIFKLYEKDGYTYINVGILNEYYEATEAINAFGTPYTKYVFKVGEGYKENLTFVMDKNCRMPYYDPDTTRQLYNQPNMTMEELMGYIDNTYQKDGRPYFFEGRVSTGYVLSLSLWESYYDMLRSNYAANLYAQDAPTLVGDNGYLQPIQSEPQSEGGASSNGGVTSLYGD